MCCFFVFIPKKNWGARFFQKICFFYIILLHFSIIVAFLKICLNDVKCGSFSLIAIFQYYWLRFDVFVVFKIP